MLDVVKPCKHYTGWVVPARTKHGTHNSYDKRTTPIDFQGQGHTLHIVFIRPTCRDVLLWYGDGVCVCLGDRPSVCGSVRKACKHDRDWTVPARAVKFGIHTTYDKRTDPIDFQGQGSKVKVTRWTLLLNLVNTIQTEPFELGLSNLVHILLMTRGRSLLIFKVRGQRSRSHVTHSC